MQDRHVAAIDIGSSKITLCVAKCTGASISPVFYKKMPSEGVRNGVIFNPMKASEPIKLLLGEAEESLGIHITQAVVSLPNTDIKCFDARYEIDRSKPDDFISAEELERMEDLAMDGFASENLTDSDIIFSSITQSYSVDDMFQASSEEIIGGYGQKISGNYKIITGRSKAVSSIIKTLNLANGTAIAEQCFTPKYYSDVVLTNEEKDGGVALVEIGAGSTSVSIYHRGIMREFASFKFGSDNVTIDIKNECGITHELADNIKKGYGICTPEGLLSMSEKILQINDVHTGESKHLPVKYLSEIIRSRMTEIFNAVLWIIAKSGYSDKLRYGVVLCGGGASLTGCSALLKSMSGYTVRIGYPHIDSMLESGVNGLSETDCVATIALLKFAHMNRHINCCTEKDGLFSEEEIAPEQPRPQQQEEEPRKEKKEKPKKEKTGKFAATLASLFPINLDDEDNM